MFGFLQTPAVDPQENNTPSKFWGFPLPNFAAVTDAIPGMVPSFTKANKEPINPTPILCTSSSVAPQPRSNKNIAITPQERLASQRLAIFKRSKLAGMMDSLQAGLADLKAKGASPHEINNRQQQIKDIDALIKKMLEMVYTNISSEPIYITEAPSENAQESQESQESQELICPKAPLGARSKIWSTTEDIIRDIIYGIDFKRNPKGASDESVKFIKESSKIIPATMMLEIDTWRTYYGYHRPEIAEQYDRYQKQFESGQITQELHQRFESRTFKNYTNNELCTPELRLKGSNGGDVTKATLLYRPSIKNMSFSGAGAIGTVLSVWLKLAEQRGMFENVETLHATSVGSIYSSIKTCSTAEETDEINCSNTPANFIDNSEDIQTLYPDFNTVATGRLLGLLIYLLKMKPHKKAGNVMKIVDQATTEETVDYLGRHFPNTATGNKQLKERLEKVEKARQTNINNAAANIARAEEKQQWLKDTAIAINNKLTQTGLSETALAELTKANEAIPIRLAQAKDELEELKKKLTELQSEPKLTEQFDRLTTLRDQDTSFTTARGKHPITFMDLKTLRALEPKKFKLLDVVVCSKSDKGEILAHHLNSKTAPNLSIAKAVRASMSIPLILNDVMLDFGTGKKPCTDGALRENTSDNRSDTIKNNKPDEEVSTRQDLTFAVTYEFTDLDKEHQARHVPFHHRETQEQSAMQVLLNKIFSNLDLRSLAQMLGMLSASEEANQAELETWYQLGPSLVALMHGEIAFDTGFVKDEPLAIAAGKVDALKGAIEDFHRRGNSQVMSIDIDANDLDTTIQRAVDLISDKTTAPKDNTTTLAEIAAAHLTALEEKALARSKQTKHLEGPTDITRALKECVMTA